MALFNLGILLITSKQMGSEVVGQIGLMILNIAIVQSVIEIYTGSSIVHFVPKYNGIRFYVYGLIWLFFVAFACCAILYYLKIVEFNLLIHILILTIMMSINAFHINCALGRQLIKTYLFLILLQPLLLLIFLWLDIGNGLQNNFDTYLTALYKSVGITLFFTSLGFLNAVNTNIPIHASYNFIQALKNGFLNQLANLSHTLSNRFNYYLLGSAALVGVYASSTSLVESLWIISAGISPLLLTHVANQKNTENHGRLTLLLAKISFLLSLVGVFVLYLLPNEFFIYLLGKDFSQAKTVMLYLAPGVLCISFSSIISHYFSGQGMQSIQFAANVTGLLATLLLAGYFIKRYGIVGACMAASCAYALQSFVLLMVFIKHSQVGITGLFTFKKDLELLKNQ